MTGSQLLADIVEALIPLLMGTAIYYFRVWANAHQHQAWAKALEITAPVAVGILIREAGGIANLKTPEIKNAAMAKTVDWVQNRAPTVVAGLGLTPQDIADSIDGRLNAALGLNTATVQSVAQDLTKDLPAPAQALTTVPQSPTVIRSAPGGNVP